MFNSLLSIVFLGIVGSLVPGVVYADMPEPYWVTFQDGASPVQEGILELHDNVFFYLIIIVIGVVWMTGVVMHKFSVNNSPLTHNFSHGTTLEIVWTVTPALLLVAIAFPSFKLLYLTDEVFSPSMTIKAAGHQWYWSYEYSDFLNEDGESIEFDSYMIPESDLEDGQLRLLDVDNNVVVPVDTNVRFVITGQDVIHSFAVPSLGIKVDAIPGRLNQVSTIIEREGLFYGQCSELCGVLHGFMPICIEAVSPAKYLEWMEEMS